MTKKPRVSVYISSRNYSAFLDEAIASVFRQTMTDWELLLINNGSTDDTQKIFNKYKKDKRVRLFQADNLNLPAIANLAIKNSKGKYLIRLDADDIFDEHILFVLRHNLDIHPRIDLVFPDYYLIDEQGALLRLETRNQVSRNNSKKLLETSVNGACTMFRKSVLAKAGGYREDLGAQDGFDILTKLIKKDNCLHIKLPLFYYRRHGENMTNNVERIINARRTIKRDAVKRKIKGVAPIMSIIPCREDFDVEKNLWERKVGDLTLLDILIRASLASDHFEKIVVTSDTPRVKRILKKYDDQRLLYVARPKKLTSPSANIVETLKIVTEALDPENKGVSVLSYIQAPFTSTHNLEEALHTLLLNEADSAIAVQEITAPLFKKTDSELVPLNQDLAIRSDSDVIYSDARTSLAFRNRNLNEGTVTGKNAVYFTVPHTESFFINMKRDLDLADYISKALTNK